MPKPEKWTDNQLKVRDRIAKKLSENPDVEEPYAVATNIVKRKRAKARKKD